MSLEPGKKNADDRISCRVVCYDSGKSSAVDDVVAVEEPLEIRVAGETVAITMRTPGADRALALGFLYAEGIISGGDDIGRAGHCGRPSTPEFGNVIDVLPSPGAALDPETIRAGRRGTLTSSACGVCGRERVDDLVARCRPLARVSRIGINMIFAAQTQMLSAQELFAKTGGVHAAAAFSSTGEMLACFEDVGRHNAVDKVVGTLLESADHLKAEILMVSSRASFEIVQKAVASRIATVVAVSAASSLAVDLAGAMGITLIGFARKDRMVVYTGGLLDA